MAMLSDPDQRGATLNLLRGPPGTSSYAGSEASVETATASFATDSTIGDYFRESSNFSQFNSSSPIHAQVPREPGNTLPSNPSTNTPLPLLQMTGGDTLIFISPPPSTITPDIASRRFGRSNTPLRVRSDTLLSTGSQVFVQLLSPSMQKRHITRLVKQKKIFLNDGKLPLGVQYVLDLTPEDEGEKAVEWQEKLWCPDVVLRWKSNLVDYFESPPVTNEDMIARNLEEFRQKAWGDKMPASEGEDGSPTQPLIPPPPPQKKECLPEPYSFGRHVLALERLIHIIHGSDPLVQTTVDWYTLHCLSVAFGTTDATRDYIARWIFSNSLMIETHPAFIIRIAAEAGLATIASDAFAAAVMRASFDPEETAQVPGATEAAISLLTRAQNELKNILSMDWIDQYLPPTSDADKSFFDTFRLSLRSYISRRMKQVGNLELVGINDGELEGRAVQRITWVNLGETSLASENSSLAPSTVDTPARFDLEQAIRNWGQWEASGEGASHEVDDLWRDVKSGAPHYPIPSVTQQTTTHKSGAHLGVMSYEDDATSEVISNNGTELASQDDDVKSISSTHTINIAMGALKTENDNSIFHNSSQTLVEPQASVDPFQTGPSNYDAAPIASTQPLRDILDVQSQSTIGIKTEDEDEKSYQSGYLTPPIAIKPIIKTSIPLTPLQSSDAETPLWLQEQLITLNKQNSPAHFWAVMHHPSHDINRPAEPRIRCADCPDMLYFPGPGATLDNFRVHLRNIKHLSRVEARKHHENAYAQLSDYGTEPYRKTSSFEQSKVEIEIPFSLLNIIRLCETYIKSKCAEMAARNIVFEPIILEEQLACLEDPERAFMPVWSGGEAVVGTKGVPHRGISDQSANDDMSVNVSTVGVGSVCTASTFSTTGSYVDIETPGASSSGSVISLSESGDDDDAAMSAPGEGDDWVMSDGDDEDYEVDDDVYFS
ncbi:hypothetical protein TWF788_003993 [Orbilia oligospora]|uniref:Uncharacterized protein n=1 Tax=Orbilia oligospora TaxID=2813651 RepID=A0A7C8KBA4_ORBOL|nr:hypothetical protein TWF788_003993 [Orbilia oligospora]